jgi:hypothetical protein
MPPRGEHGRSGQEGLGPVLMGPQQAKEPGALGEPLEQPPIVACQPAILRPIDHGFARMQPFQGDRRTGLEVGLRVCGQAAHLLLDLVEQRHDQRHRDHAALLSWKDVTETSTEESFDDCKPQNLRN